MNYRRIKIPRSYTNDEIQRPTNRVIVSFSTLPSRTKYLQDIINNIDEQTFTPDIVYINIPYFSKREKRKYPDIPPLKSKFPIKIIRGEDYGPLTKLLPTLHESVNSDDIIITIDDDQIYHRDFLKRLVHANITFPNACVTFGGWNYQKIFGFPIQLYAFANSQVDILQGYKGVAYRRHFFANDFFTDHKRCKKCFTVDDIYISFHLRKQHIPIYKIKFGKDSPLIKSKDMGSPLGRFNLSNFVWGTCIKKLEGMYKL